MSKFNECCICFEEIGTKNNCTTPCGHQFCFVCMSRSLANNNKCPCCREVLMESQDDDEVEDVDYDSDEDYDDDDDEDDDFDFPEDTNIDLITERFLQMGYEPSDLVAMMIGRIKERCDKYSPEAIKKMFGDFNEIVNEMDTQKEEIALFAAEDIRI